MKNFHVDSVNDLVGKLLATENIRIFRSTDHLTGMFDIKNRNLFLPIWERVSNNVNQMLMAHEVSHALYTTQEYADIFNAYSEKTKTLRSDAGKQCLNILEDARVEKLIKRQYPGLRKVFNNAYQELNNLDFFGLDKHGVDINTMHLCDRINILFKLGTYRDVKFDDKEMVFVDRAGKLETLDETIQLAKDILEFLKENTPPEEKATPNDKGVKVVSNKKGGDNQAGAERGDDNEVDDQGEPGDDDTNSKDDDNEVDDQGEPGDDDTNSKDDDNEVDDQGEAGDDDTNSKDDDTNSKGDSEDEGNSAAPETNKSFQQHLNNLTSNDVVIQYWKMPTVEENLNFNHIIIPFSKIINLSNVQTRSATIQTKERDMFAYKLAIKDNVNYLLKEFNMRKAATSYKKTQTSRTGDLNVNKLWSYKVKEDIFKTITTSNQGQNHGMLFLFDWSSSMNPQLDDTIDQLIYLVSFCRAANIPFQVLAFTNSQGLKSQNLPVWQKSSQHKSEQENNAIDTFDPTYKYFRLIELFASKMTNNEFNQMIELLKSRVVEQVFQLASTPLNETLMFAYEYMAVFQAKFRVEKMSLVTLTDGEGDNGSIRGYSQAPRDFEGTKKIINYLIDKYSKQTFEFEASSCSLTQMFLKIIKKRYNCPILGFHIISEKHLILSSLNNISGRKLSDYCADNSVVSTEFDFRNQLNTKKCLCLPKFAERDEMFILCPSNLDLGTQVVLNPNRSSKQLSNSLTQQMKKRQVSRVVLNKFIEHIA